MDRKQYLEKYLTDHNDSGYEAIIKVYGSFDEFYKSGDFDFREIINEHFSLKKIETTSDINIVELLKHPLSTRIYIERLQKELETERMRLAGCGIAALSGEQALDCIPEYKSASMFDVIKLYRKNEYWKRKAEFLAGCVQHSVSDNIDYDISFDLYKEYEDRYVYDDPAPKLYKWLYKPNSAPDEPEQWKLYHMLLTEKEIQLTFDSLPNWSYKKFEDL